MRKVLLSYMKIAPGFRYSFFVLYNTSCCIVPSKNIVPDGDIIKFMHLLLQPVIPLLECTCSKLLLDHLFSFNILRLSSPLDNLDSLLKQANRNFLFFLGKLLLEIESLSFKKKDL